MAFTTTATEWFLHIHVSPGPREVTELSYLQGQAWHGKIVLMNKQTKCMIWVINLSEC